MSGQRWTFESITSEMRGIYEVSTASGSRYLIGTDPDGRWWMRRHPSSVVVTEEHPPASLYRDDCWIECHFEELGVGRDGWFLFNKRDGHLNYWPRVYQGSTRRTTPIESIRFHDVQPGEQLMPGWVTA